MTTLLVDASGYIYRSYFATEKEEPQFRYRSDGFPVAAVRDFTKVLWRMSQEGVRGIHPDRIGVIFDAPGRGFRHDLFPAYKAHRPDRPNDLLRQLPIMRDAASALGFIPIELAGYEADDLIATYTRLAIEDGDDVIVASFDKDLMQIVRDGVRIFSPACGDERFSGFRPERWIDAAEVFAKFGVPPELVVEVQALSGDTADGIPGVPGVGPKTAAKLIQEYGDVETVIRKAVYLPPRVAGFVMARPDLVRLSRQLVELRDDVPVTVPLDALAMPEIDADRLLAFCDEFEFRTLAGRVRERFQMVAA